MVVVFEKSISNSLHIKKIRMYKAKMESQKKKNLHIFRVMYIQLLNLPSVAANKTNPTTSSSYLTLTETKKKIENNIVIT